MKLNYPRTLLVGLAFFSICAFWQLYDATVPLMLQKTFHMGDGLAGFVMALDNVLALVLLPLFGHLSDRTRTRAGRRMPYILLGTLAAAPLMGILARIGDGAGPAGLPLFIGALALLLVAMGSYRSPAVALMPDVTPRPLRSKANALINLMGALGGMVALRLIQLLVAPGEPTRYQPVYIAVAAVMALSAGAMACFVRENRLRLPEAPEAGRTPGGKLPRDVRNSLLLILCSVFFWFMGYNAITTAFTKYAARQWGMALGDASGCLMVATVGAVLSYVPIGFLSSRFGRKKMILAGILLMVLCFALGAAIHSPGALGYLLFAVIGFAWAAINVNSYPMVVELASGADVGKYTGFYYTFSMAAQIMTPVLSGFLLEKAGYFTLFPYAALMVALSFVTMSFTRHGDSKPAAPASKLEAFDTPD